MSADVAEAERSVLGAIMLQSSVIEEVSDIVRPADFMAPLHEEMFAAMLVMHEEGTPIDAITLGNRLATSNMLRNAGGAVFLFDLVAATPTASNAAYYAQIVAQDGGRRRLHHACIRGAQLSEAHHESGMTAAEMREVILSEIDASMSARSTVQFADALAQEYLASLDEPVTWVPTPWPSLNFLIGGWRPGALYIIAARPGVGKSIMGFEAATELSLHGAVPISSLEMGRMEVMQRIIANKADVSMNSLMNHRLTREERWRVEAAVADMSRYRLAVDDRTNVLPLDIGAHARSVARRSPVSGVVVDYMQLMGSSVNAANRQEAVAEMSRQLKLLARSMEIPVLALSQLNRGPEQRGGLPTMADLRESGAIEQDADVIILASMKREVDPVDGAEIESTSETTIQVAKNRHGSTGTFTLIREGEFSRFRQPAFPDQRTA